LKKRLFGSFKNYLGVFSVIGLTLAFSTSCSKGEESDLKALFPGALTYALPVPATSCASVEPNDLAKNTITYKNVTLSWTNATDSVYIIAMKLEFKSANLSGGNYTCTIAGDELGRVFAATDGTAWDGTLYPASGATVARLSVTNTCNVKCGGVAFADGLPTTTAVGTVTVIGIQRNPSSGEEKPVKGVAQIKLNYGGL
jgi:hypothetical protein